MKACTTHTVELLSNPAKIPHHAVIDTGCSANILCADAPVVHANPNAPTQYVGTPSGATLKSSASALLSQQNLPNDVRAAHLYPGLAYKSLLLVG